MILRHGVRMCRGGAILAAVLERKDQSSPGGMPHESPSMEMDALTAHLDRGWDLLNRGDLAAARVSADHILQLDPDSPEGYTLLGAIAAAEGDAEEALELFRRALDVDPEYVDAMLHAADTAIHGANDLQLALQYCEEAEELVGEAREELADIALLRSEAYLAAGRLDEARRELEGRGDGAGGEGAYHLRLGRLLLELDQRSRAIEPLQRALQHEPSRADAHYFLGVTFELEERLAEAQQHFISAFRDDQQHAAVPWAATAEAFEEIVRQVIAAMPAPLGEPLRSATLFVLGLPALELVVEGLDPRAPVFFAGVPKQEEEPSPASPRKRLRRDPTGVQLHALFVYQRNVERFAGSPAALAAEVHRALVIEGTIFFGLSEEQADRLLDPR